MGLYGGSRMSRGSAKYDYNIYLIPQEKKDSLIAHIKEREFKRIKLSDWVNSQEQEYAYELFFCDKDKNGGVSWVKELRELTEVNLPNDSVIYGAVLLFTYHENCFAISYGNAHFYLGRFCDVEFGLKVAERLIDLSSTRAQKNISFGSNISRSYVDYNRSTPLSYRTGEIPIFIQGQSTDVRKWGSIIRCGISAQFKWEAKAYEIHEKLMELSFLLTQKEIRTLPRLVKLDEKDEGIINLNNQLADAITKYDNNYTDQGIVHIPTIYLSGTRIIQNDIISYHLSCGRTNKDFTEEFDINAINNFANKHGLNLSEEISRIKIKFEYASGEHTRPEPILKYIDYVSDENFCLFEGNWYQFNDEYIENMFANISNIGFEQCPKEDAFCPVSLQTFAKENNLIGDEEPKRNQYETWYNHYYAQKYSLICLHPRTISRGGYKTEYCDLYDTSGNLYFVKIGEAGVFAQAIDQANLTLNQLLDQKRQLKINTKRVKYEGGQGEIIEEPHIIKPTKLVFLFIFNDRKKFVTRWRDINSINFLVHLDELRYRAVTQHLGMEVRFVYNTDCYRLQNETI